MIKSGEIIATLTNVRHSPFKMRVVANEVKSLPLAKMQVVLAQSVKKAAPYVLKTVQSALANAKHNFNLSESEVRVKEIQIGEARRVKKPNYRARGRMDMNYTRYSHVRVVLEPLVAKGEKGEKPVSAEAVKAKVAKTKDTSTTIKAVSKGKEKK